MLQFICIEFFIKMESRAETAVKSEIIFYTTKRGLESADRNEIRMFATMKKASQSQPHMSATFDVHSV